MTTAFKCFPDSNVPQGFDVSYVTSQRKQMPSGQKIQEIRFDTVIDRTANREKKKKLHELVSFLSLNIHVS